MEGIYCNISTFVVSDLATSDLGPVLPDQSADRIPLYAKLLLPVPILKPSGDGPVQDQPRGLFLPVAAQLVVLRPDRIVLEFHGALLYIVNGHVSQCNGE